MSTTEFATALVQTCNKEPYTSELYQIIKASRQQLGTLFFDILLNELTKLDAKEYFPPKDQSHLLLLLQRIEQSETKLLNKACLIFYLFLDFSVDEDDDLAGYFANEIDMPMGYKEMIHGFYLLDRLQFDEALIKLCHPEVSEHFADKIISCYMKFGNDNIKAQQTVAYIYSTTPALITPETLDFYVQMLCNTNLYTALEFARSASDDSKLEVFKAIVQYSFQNNPRVNLMRLVNLPLTIEESNLINNEILQPIISTNGADAALAKDVLLMRSLHTGDIDTAKEVTKNTTFDSTNRSNDKNAVNWSDLSRGLTLSSN